MTYDKIENVREAVADSNEQTTSKLNADINRDIITCTASEVLRAEHGICFAKSHLLAALLRCKSIPTGFCYQKLTFGDETSPVLVYHGLNGVYLNEYKKWIRLDARGNKGKINAQFSIDEEQLAYLVCTEKGEEDGLVIYPAPDVKILEKLRNNKTRTELWNDLIFVKFQQRGKNAEKIQIWF